MYLFCAAEDIHHGEQWNIIRNSFQILWTRIKAVQNNV